MIRSLIYLPWNVIQLTLLFLIDIKTNDVIFMTKESAYVEIIRKKEKSLE